MSIKIYKHLKTTNYAGIGEKLKEARKSIAKKRTQKRPR